MAGLNNKMKVFKKLILDVIGPTCNNFDNNDCILLKLYYDLDWRILEFIVWSMHITTVVLIVYATELDLWCMSTWVSGDFDGSLGFVWVMAQAWVNKTIIGCCIVYFNNNNNNMLTGPHCVVLFLPQLILCVGPATSDKKANAIGGLRLNRYLRTIWHFALQSEWSRRRKPSCYAASIYYLRKVCAVQITDDNFRLYIIS